MCKKIELGRGKKKSSFFSALKCLNSPIRTATLTVASLVITHSFPIFITPALALSSVERLSSLLNATPAGGWVKVSTNAFSDAWPTGADAVPIPSQMFPGQVVSAWSSFAWDSTRGNLIIFGGGHANYAGNEVYVWDGATGKWGRGSLPSRLDADGFIPDNSAPQSSHTYDNNLYLPVNDMFLTFGGAAWPSGHGFEKREGTNIVPAGPYVWDATKADPNKVGGTTGSGWNTTNIAPGGQMWIDRQGQWTGSQPQASTSTAYRTENGKDVVYLSGDQAASGFPSLYRYTLGDVRNGGVDKWEQIGVSVNTIGFQGDPGTLDPIHNLYIKTATVIGPNTSDLTVWDLDNANAANPNSNPDIGINLVKSDGSDFVMTGFYGLDYDKATNRIYLWDGKDGGGKVWAADVITDSAGNIGSNTTWTVYELDSSTVEHPHGNFVTAVFGKWHYDPTLNAFIALDEVAHAGGSSWNADVWLYKPAATIPEPETYALMLAGVGVIGWAARRRKQQSCPK